MGNDNQDDLDEYLEHARREMFPKMKSSTFSVLLLGDPDPKLCLELGAAILFDKPILVVVPRGASVPLSLRTIAHKIVEVIEPMDEDSTSRFHAAITEMLHASRFRGSAKEGS